MITADILTARSRSKWAIQAIKRAAANAIKRCMTHARCPLYALESAYPQSKPYWRGSSFMLAGMRDRACSCMCFSRDRRQKTISKDTCKRVQSMLECVDNQQNLTAHCKKEPSRYRDAKDLYKLPPGTLFLGARRFWTTPKRPYVQRDVCSRKRNATEKAVKLTDYRSVILRFVVTVCASQRHFRAHNTRCQKKKKFPKDHSRHLKEQTQAT